MSRELRRVPPNWSHPRDGRGRHIPLADGSDFAPRAARRDEEARRWAEGWRDDCRGGWEPVPER